MTALDFIDWFRGRLHAAEVEFALSAIMPPTELLLP